MTSEDKSFWLASIGAAAVVGCCLWGAPANADEASPTHAATAIDMNPTASLKIAVSTGPTTRGDLSAAKNRHRQTDEADISIQPELPPDAGGEPPTIAAPSVTTAPPAPAADGSHSESRPLTTLNDEPHAPPPASAGASAGDVEAIVQTMLREDVKAKPIGAGNWRAARIAIGVFYYERAFAPVWTNEDGFTPSARAAIAHLSHAREDGLDLSALAVPAVGRKGLSPAQLAEADVMLSEAIVAYAIQASGGRVTPGAISPEITAKPEVAEPFKALAQVAAAGDPAAALEDFNPPQKGYRDLRDKLAELRAQDAPVAQAIPPGPILKIGMVDPRVALIRARFGLDALSEGQASSALVYDAHIAAAVANFQRANGLPPSGMLNAGTVQALSGGASSRQEAAILANMEMWRWEPRDMGEERVEVNIPDFMLKVTQGDEVIHRARVIVGKPDTQTAIFSNQIKYLLLNPAWNVPMSIIKKEMMPKLANDPDYLTKAGFEVTRKGDTLYVRQPPGERNALGHILFMFPNEHSIYLHDTPSRGLFASQRRAFSHGCVRVDDPMRLGELAMGGADKGWTQARLRALVGDTERTIFLSHPLAIHIEYFTAFVDDAGALQMREDLYGHTGRVEAALGLRG